MKKQDESHNEFTCIVCEKIRLRGVYRRFKNGREGKVCQSKDCQKRAAMLNLTSLKLISERGHSQADKKS